MKTIIRTVFGKKTQKPKIHQTKRHKQNQIKRTQMPSPLKWPLLLGHHRPPPVEKAIKKPPPNEQRHGTKLEKIGQEQQLPQQKTDLRPCKQWKRKMRHHI